MFGRYISDGHSCHTANCVYYELCSLFGIFTNWNLIQHTVNAFTDKSKYSTEWNSASNLIQFLITECFKLT